MIEAKPLTATDQGGEHALADHEQLPGQNP
jgi:hypothetical protein